MEKLYTINEASEILRIRPQTLRLWACKNKYGLKYCKIGGLIRFRPKDIQDFINKSVVKEPRPVEEILESLDKCQV